MLLLANALYLGWEIDRDARLARNDAGAVIRIPPGTPRLELLSELQTPPAPAAHPDPGARASPHPPRDIAPSPGTP